jgi:hypothetical protein
VRGSQCKIGLAYLHGLAVRGKNLLPHAAALRMFTMTPSKVQNFLQINTQIHDDWYLKKQSFV